MLQVRKYRQLIKADVNLPSPNTVVPRENRDIGYAKFWGVNKVHYSLRENGEYDAIHDN